MATGTVSQFGIRVSRERPGSTAAVRVATSLLSICEARYRALLHAGGGRVRPSGETIFAFDKLRAFLTELPLQLNLHQHNASETLGGST